jgi:hypothetical protein
LLARNPSSPAAVTEVVWFKNAHEHRNYPLRFGLMRLHRDGRIRYSERPLADCAAFGFPAEVARHEHRHTSVIAVSRGGRRAACIVDSEDSFYWMSSLVRWCDVYFCAGYNAALFEGKSFPEPYAWQQAFEVAFYRERAGRLIAEFGEHFPRVRRFVPIGPSMIRRTGVSYMEQRVRNLHHKLRSAVGENQPWLFDFLDFELRYSELLGYRRLPLTHDVVLLDTLWGWPRHRLALHRQLQQLAPRFDIHSRLNWSAPVDLDGGTRHPLDASEFPIAIGAVGDYERMLAMSRLAVFATGFHWGWRNIMILALMAGLPVHSDPLLVEPWFDMREFRITWNQAGDWQGIAAELQRLTEDEWLATKAHNQAVYDRYLAPEAVAGYFVETALAKDGGRSAASAETPAGLI